MPGPGARGLGIGYTQAAAYFPEESPQLAAGFTSYPRHLGITSATVQTSQSLCLTFFTANKTESVTAAAMVNGTTAAGATPTLVRFGLYLEDPTTRDVSLVASTVNDTTIFAGANTRYSKNLSASYTLTAGSRYAFAHLVVSAAAMPTPMGSNALGATTVANTELNRAPRICSIIASQADLPASITDANLTSGAARIIHYGTLI